MAAESSYGEEREDLRPLLLSIAYRMVGSATEAEDVVQDAYLRYHGAAGAGEVIESAKAYLLVIVTPRQPEAMFLSAGDTERGQPPSLRWRARASQAAASGTDRKAGPARTRHGGANGFAASYATDNSHRTARSNHEDEAVQRASMEGGNGATRRVGCRRAS